MVASIDPKASVVKVRNGVLRIEWSKGGVTRTFAARNFENASRLGLAWLEPLLKINAK
jgi:hypothetical protein